MVGIAAAVLLLGGCKAKSPKGTPPAAKDKPEIVVRAGLTAAMPGHPAAWVFTVGGRAIREDLEELTRAISAEKAALAGRGGDPAVLRMVADAGVPYSEAAFLMVAASECGFRQARLVVGGASGLAASRGGQPLAVDSALPPPRSFPADYRNPYQWTVVRVSEGPGGRQYEVSKVSVVMTTKGELEAALRRRRLEGGESAAVCVAGRDDMPVELVADAAVLAASIGFAQVSLDLRIAFGDPGPKDPLWGPPPPPPPLRFFTIIDQANHVVYLIDRSGSMGPRFDEARVEVLKSISRLQPTQGFAVLLMARGAPSEGPRRSLVPADIDNKLAAAEFVRGVAASGPTALLPSLKRAFELFRAVNDKKAHKVVCLVTDGEFAGTSDGSVYFAEDGRKLQGDGAIIQWLRDNNRDKAIRVHTVLLWNDNPAPIDVLKTIAEDSGGKFRRIRADG